MPRLLVANLAAEIEMARAATPGPHPDLTPTAERQVARAACHLAVFTRPGDHFFIPGAGLEPPPGPPDQILAWAETDSIAALRARSFPVPGSRLPVPGPLLTSAPHPHPDPDPDPDPVPVPVPDPDPDPDPVPVPDPDPDPDPDPGAWTHRLWRLHPSAAVARACNDRRFAFALAAEHGWTLPGARIIDSTADLPDTGAWVAKAPFSAAGRERLRWTGAPPADLRVGLERLLARFGALLVEPWVDRFRDLGCAGLVGGSGLQVFAPHRMEVDPRGVFRAALIDDSGAEVAGPPILAALRDTALAAGQALAAAGYRGPFSVDAYLWRDRTGAARLQRLSEINARLTFGLVARAAAERAGGGRYQLRL